MRGILKLFDCPTCSPDGVSIIGDSYSPPHGNSFFNFHALFVRYACPKSLVGSLSVCPSILCYNKWLCCWWENSMKIIFQGRAFSAWEETCQVLFSFPCVYLINAIKKCCRAVDGWTSTMEEILPISLFFLLRFSRTEQWGADTVWQPDLYSGQTVYYIKKVMGFCKCTCPTFLKKKKKKTSWSLPPRVSVR